MGTYKSISVSELLGNNRIVDDSLLVDIRSEIAYKHGYIPNAVSLPEPVEPEILLKIMKEHAKEKVILYCSIGERSKAVVRELCENGIDAYNLTGGYHEWLLMKTGELCMDEKIQYARQMVLPEPGETGQERIKEARVLVIGAGALGSIALTYLAAAGVGTIGIAEGDIIERSNLHRQILFDTDNVGNKKVYEAKSRLEKMNTFIHIEDYDTYVTPDNINDIIKNYDFVIDATDNIETKFLINDACVINKIPFCHAGVVAFEGQVMTWVPGEAPCYRCVFEDIPDGYIPNCAQAGIIGAMAGMIGCIQALEAIKYIASVGELLVGKIYHINGLNMQTRIIRIPRKNISCKVCGRKPVITNVSDNSVMYRRRNCMT